MIQTAVILAAGQGTRLRPYTDDRPKCMVEVRNKPIIMHQLDTLDKAGVKDIIAVCGYREDQINDYRLRKVINSRYASTNMVVSLFCAEELIKAPVLICYGDIIYSPQVLAQVVEAEGDIVIASDGKWLEYWQERCEDPLSDAETFQKTDDGKVLSLGKKAATIDEIQGQYIGMIKFSEKGWEMARQAYHDCKKSADCSISAWGSGRDFDNAYMTDFLNHFASQGLLHYTEIQRGWFEVDNHEDLQVANRELDF
jgi:L-glutamine-phosphate cytidylyltransferase